MPIYMVCMIILYSIENISSTTLDLNDPSRSKFRVIQYTKENVITTIIYPKKNESITQVNDGQFLLFTPWYFEKIVSVKIIRFKFSEEALVLVNLENAVTSPEKYFSKGQGPFVPIDIENFELKLECLSNKPKYDPSKIVIPGKGPNAQTSFKQKIKKKLRSKLLKEQRIASHDIINPPAEPPSEIFSEILSDSETDPESGTKSDEPTQTTQLTNEPTELEPETIPVELESDDEDHESEISDIDPLISSDEEIETEKVDKRKLKGDRQRKDKQESEQHDKNVDIVAQALAEEGIDLEKEIVGREVDKIIEKYKITKETQTDIPTGSIETQTDIQQLENIDTQTDIQEVEDIETQTDLPTGSIEIQTDIQEVENIDTQTDIPTGSIETQTDIQEVEDIDIQTDIQEVEDIGIQTIGNFSDITEVTKKHEKPEVPKRRPGRPRKHKPEPEQPKRKRGRPRKHKPEPEQPKRKRGRPRKQKPEPESDHSEESTQPHPQEQETEDSIKALGPSPEKRPFSFDIYCEDRDAEDELRRRAKRFRSEPLESHEQEDTTDAGVSSGAGAPPPPGDGSEPSDGPGDCPPPEQDQDDTVLVQLNKERILYLEDPGSNKGVNYEHEINDGIPTLIIRAKPHKTITHIFENGLIICEAEKGSKLLSLSAFSYYNEFILVEIIFKTPMASYNRYFRKHGGDWKEVNIKDFEVYYQDLRGNVIMIEEMMVDISLPIDPSKIFSKTSEKNGIITTILMPLPGFFIKQVTNGANIVWSSNFRRCLAITMTSRNGDMPRLLMLEISGPNDGVTEELHFHRIGDKFSLISSKLYDTVVYEESPDYDFESTTKSPQLIETDHSSIFISSKDSISSESTNEQTPIEKFTLQPETIHLEISSDEEEPIDLSIKHKSKAPESVAEPTEPETITLDLLSSHDEEHEDSESKTPKSVFEQTEPETITLDLLSSDDEEPIDLSIKHKSKASESHVEHTKPETITVEISSDEEPTQQTETPTQELEPETITVELSSDEEVLDGWTTDGDTDYDYSVVQRDDFILVPLQVINNENCIEGIHKGVPYRTYTPPKGILFDRILSGNQTAWKALEGCGTDYVRLFFVLGIPRFGFFRLINLLDNDTRKIFIIQSQGELWNIVHEVHFLEAFYDLIEPLPSSSSSQESSEPSSDT
ncbi:Tashat2 protein [Theileria annulata]|nr:Tashat2 protein [Theileria annulata]CAI73502.1 Tashat2 protein [Theileria annulata]|eukprot:XP_954179.1 Tashat2 protein [Theileria annulata]